MEFTASPPNSKHAVLRDTFGFDSFRPGQEKVIDTLLADRNVLAVLPTGAGKSLCYQIPALLRDGLAIVVSPLVALMHDQVSSLKLAGVAADTINSANDRATNIEIWQRALAGSLKLLYLSPERLMTETLLSALQQQKLSLIVVDEAHCISQWGPAFRPEYADLAHLHELFPKTPIAALTATADEITRTDIVAQLFAGNAETYVQGFDRPNIRLSVTAKEGGSRQLLDFLMRHEGASGIVYCLSRKKTEATTTLLKDRGIRALTYHAGMDKGQRDANQNAFMTEPGTIMVATIAFGMGIDKSDIRFVFHADMPASIEAYYQELGRAGRDGAPAEAHMLFGLDDIRMRRTFIDAEDTDADRKRREHQRLDALVGYCEAPTCRRRTLLKYFGETTDACGNCDVCINPVELTDGTEFAQMALSAVYRTGQRFGAAHIVDVLRGTETDKIANAGHHLLPTFGVGAAIKKQEWRALLRQLVSTGFLAQDIAAYGGLKITETGRILLRGQSTFEYRKPAQAPRPRKARGTTETSLQAPLSGTAQALLDRLKVLRLQLAKERGVPAYVIFPDRSLEEMARRRPATRDAFAEINGVGAVKLREFADRFLAEIADTV